MRRALVVSCTAAILALLAIAAGADSVPRARMDQFESGCRSGCTREGGPIEYCKPYCQCVRRELFTGRTSREVDALYAVMRPDAPDGPAKKQLQELMDGCIQEVDAR